MNEQFSVQKAVLPIFGYLIVVYVCLSAGNVFRTHEFNFHLWEVKIPSSQFLFWLLLIPFYLNRIVIFEQKESLIPKDQITEENLVSFNSYKKKVLIFSYQLSGVILVFSIFVYVHLQIHFSKLDWNLFYREVPYFILGLLPFYLQMLRSDNKLRKAENIDQINQLKELLFYRFYIFFPALSTCIIPFIFGWCNFSHLPFLACSSAAVLLFWFVSRLNKYYILFVKFFLFLTLLITVYSLFPIFNIFNNDILTCAVAFSAGFLMTMTMGITESWWFLKDRYNFSRYEKDDQKLYTESVHKTTAIVPFLLPLAFLFPNSNLSYWSLLVFAYAIFLYLIWFFTFEKQHEWYWYFLRFICGIIAPLFIILMFIKKANIHDPNISQTLVTVIGGVAITLFFYVANNVKKITYREKYYLKHLVYTILWVYVFVYLASTITNYYFLANDSKNETYILFLNKTIWLILFYLIIGLFLSAVIMWEIFFNKDISE